MTSIPATVSITANDMIESSSLSRNSSPYSQKTISEQEYNQTVRAQFVATDNIKIHGQALKSAFVTDDVSFYLRDGREIMIDIGGDDKGVFVAQGNNILGRLNISPADETRMIELTKNLMFQHPYEEAGNHGARTITLALKAAIAGRS